MKTEADFELDLVLDTKSAVNEDDDGLIIEGLASDFGMDRDDEAFEPGVWEAAEKQYMTNPVIMYNHNTGKSDVPLGRALEVSHLPNNGGAWLKARIDKPEPGTPSADIYRKIKSGTIRAFSVGGKFHRRPGADGKTRIYKADWRETSVCGIPSNPRTLYGVAGKSFGDDELEWDSKAADDLVARADRLLERLEGLEAKSVSAAKRKDAKFVMAGGKYPIDNCSDVAKAAKLAGNGTADKSSVVAHVKNAAKKLGFENSLPDSWS